MTSDVYAQPTLVLPTSPLKHQTYSRDLHKYERIDASNHIDMGQGKGHRHAEAKAKDILCYLSENVKLVNAKSTLVCYFFGWST
jgi:hypothetical protein